MSFRRSDGPADRAESERLLDQARGGRRRAADPDPLVNLLAAAAAPANPGELSGEEQAMAAFRAARAGIPAPVPARVPRRRRLRAGAAAWAAGLAATATAGAAFAAVSLDRPEQPAPPPQSGTPGNTGSGGSPSQTGSGDPTGGGPASSPGVPSTAGGGPGRPAGTEQLTGLCRAYLAKPAGQRARALETAAFADLVAAAGGADRVDGLCRRLVPDPAPKPSPSVRATGSPGPATVPTPAAPTGRPGTRG